MEGAEYKSLERESSVSSDKPSTDETKSREQNDNDEKAEEDSKRTNIEHRRAYFYKLGYFICLFIRRRVPRHGHFSRYLRKCYEKAWQYH